MPSRVREDRTVRANFKNIKITVQKDLEAAFNKLSYFSNSATTKHLASNIASRAYNNLALSGLKCIELSDCKM